MSGGVQNTCFSCNIISRDVQRDDCLEQSIALRKLPWKGTDKQDVDPFSKRGRGIVHGIATSWTTEGA